VQELTVATTAVVLYAQVCAVGSHTAPSAVLVDCATGEHDVTVVTVGDVVAYEQVTAGPV
jgi:hypothetical protein